MWRAFSAIALLSVANSQLSANAQPPPTCPPGTYTPACARDPHEGGSERTPFKNHVDHEARFGHIGTTGHGGSAGMGSGHGGGGGGGGGGNGGGGH